MLGLVMLFICLIGVFSLMFCGVLSVLRSQKEDILAVQPKPVEPEHTETYKERFPWKEKAWKYMPPQDMAFRMSRKYLGCVSDTYLNQVIFYTEKEYYEEMDRLAKDEAIPGYRENLKTIRAPWL